MNRLSLLLVSVLVTSLIALSIGSVTARAADSGGAAFGAAGFGAAGFGAAGFGGAAFGGVGFGGAAFGAAGTGAAGLGAAGFGGASSGAAGSSAASIGTASFGVTFDDVLALESSPPDLIERYGAEETQRREFWLHEGLDALPLVVLIHGGCWLDAFGVGHVHPLAAALRDAGFVVMAPEYRRVGDNGGGWPGSLDDTVAAVAGLAGRGRELGFDPGRVVLVGHSAGGHLALLTSLRLEAMAAAMAPGLVVGLAAITDPERYALGGGSCNAATPQMFGGMPDEVPERYSAGSPVRLRGLALDPAPVTLLQGTADTIVDMGQARRLAVGSPGVTMALVNGAGHFDLVHPRTPAFARLLDALAPLAPGRSGPAAGDPR